MNFEEGFSRLRAAPGMAQHKRLLQLETAFPSAAFVVVGAILNGGHSGSLSIELIQER